MESIKQLLKDSLITQLQMPDALYNCLKKYGYKQYLITDVIDYYYVNLFVKPNIHTYNRLFVFDMNSKFLSLYNYNFSASFGGTLGLTTDTSSYCYRSRDYSFIKAYNRMIERAYKKSLENKK